MKRTYLPLPTFTGAFQVAGPVTQAEIAQHFADGGEGYSAAARLTDGRLLLVDADGLYVLPADPLALRRWMAGECARLTRGAAGVAPAARKVAA